MQGINAAEDNDQIVQTTSGSYCDLISAKYKCNLYNMTTFLRKNPPGMLKSLLTPPLPASSVWLVKATSSSGSLFYFICKEPCTVLNINVTI